MLLSLRLILFSPWKWKPLSTGKEFYFSLSLDLLKEESVGFDCLFCVRNVHNTRVFLSKCILDYSWYDVSRRKLSDVFLFFYLSSHAKVLADLGPFFFAKGFCHNKGLCGKKLPHLFSSPTCLVSLCALHTAQLCLLPWACRCPLASFMPAWTLSHPKLSSGDASSEQLGSPWPWREASRSSTQPWKGASPWSTAPSQRACQQPFWR